MKGRARKPTMLADTRGTILAGTRVRQLSRRTDAAGVAFAPASARVPHALRTVADRRRETLLGNGGRAGPISARVRVGAAGPASVNAVAADISLVPDKRDTSKPARTGADQAGRSQDVPEAVSCADGNVRTTD